MNENIFIVNWNKLVAWLTPIMLRQPVMKAWLNTFVSAISLLYNKLIVYRDDVNYRIGITPQGVHLQRMLNDRYDIADRRIVIDNAVVYNPIPFYLSDENKPQKLFIKSEANQMVLYSYLETAAYTVDFVVKVPVLVPFNLDEMTGLIRLFCGETKTFKIIIV